MVRNRRRDTESILFNTSIIEDAINHPLPVLQSLSSQKPMLECIVKEMAVELGAFTVAFTGNSGGTAAPISDASPRIPFFDSARMQEAHIRCGYILCDWIEACIIDNSGVAKGSPDA